MFLLVPTLYNWPTEERGGKWDAVGPASSGGIKVVLTLLTKAIAVQVRVPIIKAGKHGLQRLLLRFCLDRRKRRGLVLVVVLQVGFYELLEKPFVRGRSGSWSDSKSLSPENSRRRSGSIAIFVGGSGRTSYGLVFSVWRRRVTAETAASAWPGHFDWKWLISSFETGWLSRLVWSF